MRLRYLNETADGTVEIPVAPLAGWPGGPLSWLTAFGSLDHAAACAALFWPEFVAHDGCVFFHSDDETRHEKLYADWLAACKGDKARVEATMNHRHICDVLPQSFPDRAPTREQVLAVGRMLKEMWTCKLRRDFPGERFTVSFPEDYSEDLVEYEITFFHDSKV